MAHSSGSIELLSAISSRGEHASSPKLQGYTSMRTDVTALTEWPWPHRETERERERGREGEMNRDKERERERERGRERER